MKEYRVLTLWQPWATLLVHGIKKIETRPAPTSWTQEKGIYLIHAASKWTKEQKEICLTEPFKTELEKLEFLNEAFEDHGTTFFNVDLTLGKIIGAVEVTECQKIVYNNSEDFITTRAITEKGLIIEQPEESFGDYFPGRYAWLCQNPRLLKEPIIYKGGQGYYQRFTGDSSLVIFK